MKTENKKKITILYEGWKTTQRPGHFFDPGRTFDKVLKDGVKAVNLVPYQWNLEHNWWDSTGYEWKEMVQKYQDNKDKIESIMNKMKGLNYRDQKPYFEELNELMRKGKYDIDNIYR